MDFDLRQLRHARAVAEEGSFARAARTVHLTQPALSRSIQELERRTGIRLFDRNQGRVEPTDLGRVFLAQAREILARAEALDREVASLRGTGTGRLAVGSGTFPTVLFMAEAVSAFVQRNPRVGLRLVNDNWVGLVGALRRRELDFVVAATPDDEESADLVAQPLAQRQGYFFVRPGHPLLAKAGPKIADVAAWPLVCSAGLSASVAAALLAARRDGESSRPVPDVACESHEMMRHIVATTDHVLLSGLAATADALDDGDLVALPIEDPRIGVAFAVIRLQARTLPPVADEFIREVIAADRATAAAEQRRAAHLFAASVPAARAPARAGRSKVSA